MPLCIYITFGSAQRERARFRRWAGYKFCLEVADSWLCVCVTKTWMLVFNVFISSTKVFVSTIAKRVCVQHQKCSSPAQNAFVDRYRRLAWVGVASKLCDWTLLQNYCVRQKAPYVAYWCTRQSSLIVWRSLYAHATRNYVSSLLLDVIQVRRSICLRN